MHIIIKEQNKFMPDTLIKIYEDKIELEENNKQKTLKYDRSKIKNILEFLLEISKNWEDKYIDKGIIDDDSFSITIVTNKIRQIYIKNKYPSNWSKFILFRNKLVREEL